MKNKMKRTKEISRIRDGNASAAFHVRLLIYLRFTEVARLTPPPDDVSWASESRSGGKSPSPTAKGVGVGMGALQKPNRQASVLSLICMQRYNLNLEDSCNSSTHTRRMK